MQGDTFGPPLLEDDFHRMAPRPHLPREGLVRALVLLTALAVFIPNAGSFGLWDCWETHYGEVARYMHETRDLLSPWWGYKEQIGNQPRTGEWFFSKPVLIMYGEILMIRLIGFSEWAIRLPWAILASVAVFIAYVVLARIYGRRAGLLASFVLLTSPLFFFLGRQAITDMPLVGSMTIGLLLFLNAYLGPRFEPTKRAFWGWFALAMSYVLLVVVPQISMVALDLEPDALGPNPTSRAIWLWIQRNGLIHAAIYSVLLVVLLVLIGLPLFRDHRSGALDRAEVRDRWMRRFSLWGAYTSLGLATLGKGLLGFMLPGAILFLHLLLTGEWRLLRRIELLRGNLCMWLTMLPWYVGMLAKHGQAFYARFFVHDHFNRLGAGVHQIDTGTFEHFVKWASIGTYPWVGFFFVVLLVLARLRLSDRSAGARGKVFLVIWSFFAYVLFTLSATKFHHYIFPAVPPFAMLTGIALSEFLDRTGPLARLAAIAGVAIVLGVGMWVHTDPQSYRNMFTYQYDRKFPTHLPIDPDAPVAQGASKTWAQSTFYRFTNPFILFLLRQEPLRYENFTLAFLVAAALLVFLTAFGGKIRRYAVFLLVGAGIVHAWWCLNYYMPMLSPSWSQKYIFEDYFSRCHLQRNPPEVDEVYVPILSRIGLGFIPEYLGARGKRVCEEDVIAWLVTWRGETFYTYSEIKPLMKVSQLRPYLEVFNKGKPFFALVQAHRGSSLKSYLDRETKALRNKGVPEFVRIKAWKVDTVHQESEYFWLVRATPVMAESPQVGEPPEARPEIPDVEGDKLPAM